MKLKPLLGALVISILVSLPLAEPIERMEDSPLALHALAPALSSPFGPSPRTFHDMAYDAESGYVILFGGRGALDAQFDETWAYNFTTNRWTMMNPPSAPSLRLSHEVVYVPGYDRVILFGGRDVVAGVDNAGTWEYDYNSDVWTPLAPPTAPSARAAHAMAYDVASDQIVLFGGLTGGVPGGTLLNDTWAYNLTAGTWTEMSPATSPSPRDRARMVYVPSSDRVVLFGGFGVGGALSDETWAYDFETDTWEQKSPTTHPSARHGHGLAYDSGSDRVILFSGDDVVGNDETWAYDLATDTWTQTNPSVAPGGRVGHGLAYDSNADRTILFGGEWPFLSGSSNNETWAYDYESDTWSPMTPPSAPRSLEAVPGDGVVNLTWSSPLYDYGTPVSGYKIYRGTASGSLPFLTEADNVLIYQDTSVTAGITYYYQVTAVTLAGEGPPSNEASAMLVGEDVPPTGPDPVPIAIAVGVVAAAIVAGAVYWVRRRRR